MTLAWTKEKPDYACVFVARNGEDYSCWRFAWVEGVLLWETDDGDIFGDYDECVADEYLVLKTLPKKGVKE